MRASFFLVRFFEHTENIGPTNSSIIHSFSQFDLQSRLWHYQMPLLLKIKRGVTSAPFLSVEFLRFCFFFLSLLLCEVSFRFLINMRLAPHFRPIRRVRIYVNIALKLA